MRPFILITLISISFLVGCSRSDTVQPKVSAKELQRALVLPGGQEVNTLQELHTYVRTHGFTNDVNGVVFNVVDGVLVGGLHGLVPDKTPMIDRTEAFMMHVMAEVEAYVWSLFNPSAEAQRLFNEHLRDIQTDPFQIYPSIGRRSFTGSYIDYLFEQYNKAIARSFALQAYLTTGSQIPPSLIEAFKNIFLQSYVEENFSLGEAMPWAMSGNIGLSIDAWYFNTHQKLVAAGAISDVLTDQNGQRAGVLVNIMSEANGQRMYMYIGDAVQSGSTVFSWSSTDPWSLVPDFSVLNPLASGPPIIIVPPGGINP